MFEAVLQSSFVEGSGSIPEYTWTIRFILTKEPLEVSAIPIKNLSLPLFQPILENPDKTISIAMDNFRLPIQQSFFPIPNDLDFP